MSEENEEIIEEVIEDVVEEIEEAPEQESLFGRSEDNDAEEQAPTEPVDPEIAAYEANYGYKVYDEEREIPEHMRGFITNKEIEDEFREIYGKQGAFDTVKEKHSALKERVDTHYSKIESDYNSQNANLDELSAMVQRNDMKGFYEALGIPEEKIMQYALQRAEYQEMDAQQKAQVDNQYNQNWETQNLAKQNHAYQAQIEQQEVQTRTLQLDNELVANADFVGQFDSKFGEGSFRQEVIQAGTLAYNLEQKDLMPNELVGRLKTKYGWLNEQPVQAQAAPVQNNPNQVVNKVQAKPTLPNVQGSTGSPAQKVVSSLADLRRLANTMD